MLHKLKQNTHRHKITWSHRLPDRRVRRFLLNTLRDVRLVTPSAALRAAMGLLNWSVAQSFHGENRVAVRMACFITGRARGTSQRFTVSRTRIKQLSGEGRLFGVRKSSW